MEVQVSATAAGRAPLKQSGSITVSRSEQWLLSIPGLSGLSAACILRQVLVVAAGMVAFVSFLDCFAGRGGGSFDDEGYGHAFLSSS